MSDIFKCKYCNKKGTKRELLNHRCIGSDTHDNDDDSFLVSMAVGTPFLFDDESMSSSDSGFSSGGGDFGGGGSSGSFND
jgi:hypothetical protein